MIKFIINGKEISYSGDPGQSLLNYLRNHQKITSVKDGCSGQAACGACMVEIDGKARLSCTTKMKSLAGKTVITTEGIPDPVRDIIAKAFIEKGAVQCGFCTPGLIMRTKVLYTENPNPSRQEIVKAIKNNLCRCTGYIKIVDAIIEATERLNNPLTEGLTASTGKIGTRHPKYQAYQLAVGKHHFVNDISMDGMLHAALKFSDHPRAKIISINTDPALKLEGVIRIFTAADIPGSRKTGLIFKDWPLMIGRAETTNYIGDVVAGVVATDRETARKAAAMIQVDYEVHKPVTDPIKAISNTSPEVHPGQANLLDSCIIKRGEPKLQFSKSQFTAEGHFQTQRIEHGFLEIESALAYTDGETLRLYSQGQGVYVDQQQIASLLDLPKEKIQVNMPRQVRILLFFLKKLIISDPFLFIT